MTTVTHKMRGTKYEVLAQGSLQCNGQLEEGEVLVCYKSLDDGKIWFRPASEMYDGRFDVDPPYDADYYVRHGGEGDLAVQATTIIMDARPDARVVLRKKNSDTTWDDVKIVAEIVRAAGDHKVHVPDYTGD